MPYLKGINNLGDSHISDSLEINLNTYFNYAFLEVGGYSNIESTSGAYGGDFSRLRPVQDPSYTNGQVWESALSSQGFIWESGIGYSPEPIRISGVYVNSTFYPSNTSGTYSHYVDYNLGRVVFNTAIATTSIVKLNYSSRWVKFITFDTPWFRNVVFDFQRIDLPQYLQTGSGVWDILSQNKISFPTVAVELVENRTFAPYQLGGGQYLYQDVMFHVLAETAWERNIIRDAISYQSDKTIWLFNVNTLTSQNRFPLTYDGQIASGALTYPQLTGENSGFRWRKARLRESRLEPWGVIHPKLYGARVRFTMEIDFPDLI